MALDWAVAKGAMVFEKYYMIVYSLWCCVIHCSFVLYKCQHYHDHNAVPKYINCTTKQFPYSQAHLRHESSAFCSSISNMLGGDLEMRQNKHKQHPSRWLNTYHSTQPEPCNCRFHHRLIPSNRLRFPGFRMREVCFNPGLQDQRGCSPTLSDDVLDLTSIRREETPGTETHMWEIRACTTHHQSVICENFQTLKFKHYNIVLVSRVRRRLEQTWVLCFKFKAVESLLLFHWMP